jgi:hypothetical protein
MDIGRVDISSFNKANEVNNYGSLGSSLSTTSSVSNESKTNLIVNYLPQVILNYKY